jgi:hypothetical protein
MREGLECRQLFPRTLDIVGTGLKVRCFEAPLLGRVVR